METDALASENEKLREEIRLLKEKLALFEGPPTNAEEEQKYVEKMFQLFDADKSSDIDSKEFQQLAFQLGETLSNEEVDEAVRQIDTNNDGVISFDEFYSWWRSADHSLQTEKDDGNEKGKKLKVVSMKLHSRPYMHTVMKLIEKVNQKGALVLPKDEQQGGKSLKGFDPVSVDDSEKFKGKEKDNATTVSGDGDTVKEVFTVNLSSQVGNLETAACSAEVKYDNTFAVADAARVEYGLGENSLIFIIAFTILDGVDEFELGELSGSLKDILNSVKNDLHAKDVIIRLREEPQLSSQVFEIVITCDDFENFEISSGLISAMQFKHLHMYGACSHAPLDPDPQDFVHFKGHVDAVVGHAAIEFIQAVSTNHEAPEGRSGVGDTLALLTALNNVKLNLQFDDVGSLLRHAFHDTDFGNIKGWHSFKSSLEPQLNILKDENVPPAVLSAYDMAKKGLKGVHSASLQIGDNIFQLTAKNADVIALFPTSEELGLEL